MGILYLASLIMLQPLEAVPGACADPDSSTEEGLRRLADEEPCKRRFEYPKLKGPAPATLQRAIIQLAETELFDARSARWKWYPVRGNGRIYCGSVNAKNRFGAYTGYKLFAAYRDVSGKVTSLDFSVQAELDCMKIYP